jgi:hypothetical protein
MHKGGHVGITKQYAMRMYGADVRKVLRIPSPSTRRN